MTPPREMFERNHNLIPEIEAEDYELLLMPNGKKDENPVELDLEAIKKIYRRKCNMTFTISRPKTLV